MANHLWVIEIYDSSSERWNPMTSTARPTCEMTRSEERKLKQEDRVYNLTYRYRIRKYKRDEGSRG